jgi:hypothetical protein
MSEKYLKTKDGSIEDTVKLMQNKVLESDYKDKFKKALDKEGKPLGHMTGAEKKAFFGKVDSMHTAKDEATHTMPDGTVMKGAKHKEEVKEEDAYDGTPAEVAKLKAKEKADAEKAKAKSKKEEVNETHTGQTATANRHQKSAGGEKSPISHMVNKSIEEITTNGSKTFAQMRAEVDEACWDSHKQVGTKQKGGKTVPNCVPKNESKDSEQSYPSKDAKIKGDNPADKGKKEQETGEDTRDPKDKAMTGKVATKPEMNPRVDYKY